MAEFLEYKKNVLALFDDTLAFARANGYEEVGAGLAEGRKKVAEDKLVVLVCGEMKRGKSSLLCALLEDEELFPVNVAVATCLVTMVSYAPQEKITVVLEDERGREFSKAIVRAEIGDYVTEQGNAANHKHARLMLIETPNEKLKNGFVFVDTPGVGSMNPEHSQITYNFLPRADVVLFVSDATAPLTVPELGFLKQVSAECPNILFPLTKKDLQTDCSAIMETNKEKISAATGLAREKIMMIPVSSTAKLSYLKSGRERMLKSSNYERFEALLWDVIYKNRANIIFLPPLKALAEEMQKVEKDIYVGETAFSGSAEKLQQLSDRLTWIANQRQELLSNASTWQTEVMKQLEGLTYSTDRFIDDFYDKAMSYLSEKLRTPKNIADPMPLLNEIVCMMANTSIEMKRQVLAKVVEIRDDFEEKTGFELIAQGDGELFTVKQVDFQLRKLSMTDKVVDNGRTIGMTSMGVTAVGTVVGGVVGGIVGVFGGPVGVIVGAQLGAMLGGAAGTIKGTMQVLENPTYHTEGQVRNEITRYIVSNCNAWRKDTPRYLKEIRDNLLAALKAGIESDKKSLDADIVRMKDAARLTQQQQAEGKVKYQKIRTEYNVLSKRFAAVIQAKVEDDSPRPAAPMPKEPENQDGSQMGTADYSFLEE